MTDLTLLEYRDIPKEDLRKALKQEAVKMFGKYRTQKMDKSGVEMSSGLFRELKGVSGRIFTNSVDYFF